MKKALANVLLKVVLTYLISNNSYGQYWYEDDLFRISVEMPEGFKAKQFSGKHTRYKAADGLGGGITVSVDNSPNVPIDLVKVFKEATIEQIQEFVKGQLLSEVSNLRRAIKNINGNEVVALSYQMTTPSGERFIQLSYQLIKNKVQYILIYSYPYGEDGRYLTKFYRSAQSLIVK